MWWWWWWCWLVQVVAWWCAGLVAVLCWLWASRPRVDAPGPPTLPIIGNILEFWQLPVTIRKFRDFHEKYGDFRLYLGPKLMMVVAHPDDVEHILLTCKLVDRDPYITHAIRIFAGDGIIANSGTQWKTHRKLINPVFHSELLEGFLEPFHQSGVFLCERLARARGAATVIHPPAFLVTLRIICELVIGIDPDLLIPDASAEEEFSTAVVDAMATIQTMVMRPWLQSKLLLRMSSKARSLSKYTRLLEDWAMKCIAVRSAETEEGPPKKHLTLLQSLVKPGGETVLPLKEVKDAIMNVIVAGSEASAVTVSFTLAALALHPEWQEAARRELREVFGEGEDYLRAPNMADLGRLRVLDSIIKSMAGQLVARIWPVIGFNLPHGSNSGKTEQSIVNCPDSMFDTVVPLVHLLDGYHARTAPFTAIRHEMPLLDTAVLGKKKFGGTPKKSLMEVPDELVVNFIERVTFSIHCV